MSGNGIGNELEAGHVNAEAGAAPGGASASGAGRDSASGAEARGATAVDRSFQLAYKLAYRMMRVYWGVRRPATHGALVTLWNAGELLLIQNSYVKYRSLPGGYVGRYETGAEAAVRELREETGIRLEPRELAGPVLTRSAIFDFRARHVRQDEEIFLARTSQDAVLDTSGWEAAELEFMDEVRWFHLDELAAVTIEVFPEGLVEIARGLLDGWDGVTRDLGIGAG